MRLPPTQSAGFTLIEMSVVVVLLGILMTIGMSAFQDNKGGRLRTATYASAQLFESAREVALSEMAPTRIFISNEHGSDHRRLRYMTVAVGESAEAEGVIVWKRRGEPVLLPEGIYFDITKSRLGEPNHGPREMLVDLETSPTDGAGEWYYYEFSEAGIARNAGARFIVAAGRIANNAHQLQLKEEEHRDGFVIHRAGRVSFIRDPKQIL